MPAKRQDGKAICGLNVAAARVSTEHAAQNLGAVARLCTALGIAPPCDD
jgi:hypothetical protein